MQQMEKKRLEYEKEKQERLRREKEEVESNAKVMKDLEDLRSQ